MRHPIFKLCGAMFIYASLALPAQTAWTHADDSDRDGTITRREWRGTMREFQELDVNRDGVLSGTEVPGNRVGKGRRNRDSRVRDNDRQKYGERSRSGSGVDRLDRDNSGVVEGYEWPYNRTVFHQLDTDGDSVLSREELRNITSVALPLLDTNKDGRIDEKEWPGGYADFERLDQNRDGRVAAREYFERGGEWQKRQRFDTWDTNRNGFIESTEWKSAPKLFHRLDTDGDSRVSWSEFMADTEQYRPPYDWR